MQRFVHVFIHGCIILVILLHFPEIGNSEAALPKLNENELYISFLNLPDGEATLIQTPKEENFLINTGSKKSRSDLWKQLNQLNVHQLDGLILTKQTSDYCGNIKQVLDQYHVKNIYVGDAKRNFIEHVDRNISQTTWYTDDHTQLTKELKIHVLQTNALGEMSFTIEYGKNKILYMSISELEHDQLIEDKRVKAEIIKIADYGQGQSPSTTLLETMDPHISIVFHQKSGKPNKALLERLKESWIDVYQLEQVGTTIIRLTLNDYEVIS
ncbi:hypothetical protein GCM10011351_06130 [Paraliobacillus quinghaiensis]|uniref:Hydrolase n=1 Tax=Paraliobacillus quinghaiensis TaxID=470815 RepID=A0A917TGZ4_9BACI|nr:hypothetical protein [Paraliobacillus quinghaiensis]GGM23057.1 hypothetical protein GCM10011351_06130 [Paraliobacillus quinghaiensis]